MIQDRQKSAVYKWQQKHVAPFDKSEVKFADIKAIVDYVWNKEGLKYPPMVSPLPPNTKLWAGTGRRLEVRFQPSVSTRTILHELAHAMTSDHQGRSNAHGALFMGIYCRLLAKYLNLPHPKLVQTAEEMGLQVDVAAMPVF